jgi:hypothetical protein
VTTVRRFFDHGSERLAQQSENSLALRLGPAELLRFVIEDGAGGFA